MVIAIDARFYGPEHTGLGRYTTNVMAHLPKYLQGYTLKVLLRRKYYDSLKLPSNCEKVLADFPHYSLAEQIRLPRLLDSLNCDLLYSFHFNVPLYLKTPFVVTIHDLIKSHFTTADTTTHASWFFRLKRWGYDVTIRHAVSQAVNIITPTNTVKNDILAAYNADPTKIRPIPEAPDEIFRTHSKSVEPDLKLPSKYLLFVGNAYPHKNLGLLLDALAKLPDYHLVIVAKESPFLVKLLAGRELSRLHLLSGLSDQELLTVYKKAAALITPSLMEGYGLPGLEALMVGTPVIASDIPVYREVYGDKVTYFDPHSLSELVAVLRRLPARKQPLQFDRTWDDVAKHIAEVIDESCTGL